MGKANKKKILYIITQSERGGAQKYLYELVAHLDKEKYGITMAAGPGGAFLDLLKAKKCQIYRLKHLKREINPIKDIKAYFELKNLIYTTKPDILQLNSTKTGILGSLAHSHIRKIGIPNSHHSYVIYRIGGWSFLEDIPWWKKWLYIKAEKWTSKFKDKIIVNCEAQRQLAIKLNIAPPEKIVTIYNGLDLDKLNFLPRDEARQKLLNLQNKETPKKGASYGSLKTRSLLCSKPRWQQELLSLYSKKNNLSSPLNVDNQKALVDPMGLAPATPTAKEGYLLHNTTGPKPGLKSLYHEQQNKYIIGCIANFYKNKGLEYLIKAVSQLSQPKAGPPLAEIINYQLSIIGDGLERDNLEKLIRELGLEKKIILHGQLPNAYQYLKAFDIFVLPSIKEGQPWSLMEAMAAELPCIATKIAAIPEMITNGESGLLVEPKNPKVIAEKINYLINNPDIAKNFSQKARKVIQKKFTTKKMVTQTEKLY